MIRSVHRSLAAGAVLLAGTAVALAQPGSPEPDRFGSGPVVEEAGLAMSQFGHVATPVGLSMLAMNATDGPVATPVGLSMLAMNATDGPVATPVGLMAMSMNATEEPVVS
jgi:hypothetical protein